jgi:hypothetical protein
MTRMGQTRTLGLLAFSGEEWPSCLAAVQHPRHFGVRRKTRTVQRLSLKNVVDRRSGTGC